MVEYQNIVAHGSLNKEFNIEGLTSYVRENSDLREVKEEEGATNGLEVEIEEDLPSVVVHQNGTYVIKCTSKDELFTTHKKFIKHMLKLDLIHEEPDFGVNNIIANEDIGTHIELNEFWQATRKKSTYNPEEFPAVTFKPSDTISIQVFSTGMLTISAQSFPEVLEAINHVDNVVDKIGAEDPDTDKDFKAILEERSRKDNLNWAALKDG